MAKSNRISDLRDEKHYDRVLGIQQAAVNWNGVDAVLEVEK